MRGHSFSGGDEADAAADLQSREKQVAPFSKFAIDGAEDFCANPADIPAATMPTADTPSADKQAVGVAPAAALVHTGSSTWSGYQDESGPYEKAVGHFDQPSVSNYSNASVTSWVGINGTGNGGRLVQAGTVNQVGSPTVGTMFCRLCSRAAVAVKGLRQAVC